MKHDEGEIPINVNNFKGAGVVVRVAKQPEMESVDLLVDDSQEQEQMEQKKDTGNLWSTISK